MYNELLGNLDDFAYDCGVLSGDFRKNFNIYIVERFHVSFVIRLNKLIQYKSQYQFEPYFW